MSERRIAALDIGGTKIKACLFEGDTPIHKNECDTLAHDGGASAVLERAAALLHPFLPADAIGISTAGQVDPSTGVIRYANENLPGYTGTDVKSYFKARFGCPVAVLNDVYAAALGEGTQGAARGIQNYLCITYGTGVGGGIILNGEPYYGAGSSAGIMPGGLILQPDKLSESDPFAGTYERCASTTALCASASALDPVLDNGRAIFQRLQEPMVCAVVDHWLEYVAAGIVTLIHVLNVPFVVLGGGVMEQSYAIEEAKKRVAAKLIPGFRGVKVVAAQLGNMAGLYGAAQQARQELSGE